ncbi:HAD hydrolase family protein [Demequina aurantiaca]|uniref:HAD hydrolase family protein n=1 Tax=Demequina aurantiaca TaxID=676200 RepID=UPI003D33D35D
MLKPRAIFLDIDGTYASHGVVPPGHVDAVRAARAAGNLVLLCSGRPASALPDSLTSAGFDGFVGAAGAYVRIGGKVLSDVRFPTELAARTVSALDKHGMLYILESPEGLFARPGALGLIERARRLYAGNDDSAEARRTPITSADNLHQVPFGKAVCLDGDTPIDEVVREIGPEVAVVTMSIEDAGSAAGEIYQSHLNKSVGMRIAMEHLGLTVDDIVAFGDGLNDLEMLQFAGTSVAIEGSDPRVLAAADRTAKGPQEEGLRAAFAELGLVG